MHAPESFNALLFLPTHRRPMLDRLLDFVEGAAK